VNYFIMSDSEFAGRKDLSELGGWLDSGYTALEAEYSVTDGFWLFIRW